MSAVQTLGKHEVRRQLGRGAMGIVYEGWDPGIARRVAIKTIRLPVASDDETAGEIARFRREAQAAGRLNHPNIVGVYDYGESNDLAYIVMEFVDGPTLKELLDKNERFSLSRIMRIMEDLLTGLQFSHDRGVVHRDIKPANLMLTASGQTKIADFGIARIEMSSMTQTGTVLGTPAYMSPEQLRGEVVDARSDIWSSGVLLFQLLTGKRPFDGGMSSIMHKALNVEPPPPSEISLTTPPRFDAVVRKALAKRPEDRYVSAAEFLAAIQEAAAAVVPLPFAGSDDATLIAPARSSLATAPPRPAPGSAAARSAALPGDGAFSKPRAPLISPGVVGAGAAGLAILGGIGYFLLSGSPTPSVPLADSARHDVASAPPSAASPPIAVTQPSAHSSKESISTGLAPSANDLPERVIQTPAALPDGGPVAPETPPASPDVPPPNGNVAPVAVMPPVSPSPVTPVLAPALSPPAPAGSMPSPPRAPSPLERARAAALSVPCSALNVVGGANGLRVSGFAAGGRDLDLVLSDARRAATVTDDITRLESFACAPVEAMAAPARRSWDAAPRTLFVKPDRHGPGIEIASAWPDIRVDLYQSDGSVHHLAVPAPSRPGTDPLWTYAIPSAPASGLVVAIGAARPIDMATRPKVERATDYLTWLEPRLNTAANPAGVDMAIVTMRPPEPVAAKPRPVEPAAANTPMQRPPALHSARCSNIVNRAQLGETLTNAELTALRTECRS